MTKLDENMFPEVKYIPLKAKLQIKEFFYSINIQKICSSCKIDQLEFFSRIYIGGDHISFPTFYPEGINIQFLQLFQRNIRNIYILKQTSMSRNSIEKRSIMLDKSWVNRSRCNPESSTSIAISPVIPSKQLRNQETMTTIKNQNVDNGSLQSRYLALQQMYKGLLEKVHNNPPNIGVQTKQIEKLQTIHQKNQKEIYMLRGMLGFLQKQEKSTQTQASQSFEEKYIKNSEKNIKSCMHLPKYSNHSSKDNSKIMKIQHYDYQSQVSITSPISSKNATMKLHESSSNQNWASRGSKYFINQPSKTGSNLDYSALKKSERGVSPGISKEKYRFIPSLPLN